MEMYRNIGLLYNMIMEQPSNNRNNFIAQLRRNLTEYIADKKLNLKASERKKFNEKINERRSNIAINHYNETDQAYMCYIKESNATGWDRIYRKEEDASEYEAKLNFQLGLEANETLFKRSNAYKCTEDDVTLLQLATILTMWDYSEKAILVILYVICETHNIISLNFQGSKEQDFGDFIIDFVDLVIGGTLNHREIFLYGLHILIAKVSTVPPLNWTVQLKGHSKKFSTHKFTSYLPL